MVKFARHVLLMALFLLVVAIAEKSTSLTKMPEYNGLTRDVQGSRYGYPYSAVPTLNEFSVSFKSFSSATIYTTPTVTIGSSPISSSIPEPSSPASSPRTSASSVIDNGDGPNSSTSKGGLSTGHRTVIIIVVVVVVVVVLVAFFCLANKLRGRNRRRNVEHRQTDIESEHARLPIGDDGISDGIIAGSNAPPNSSYPPPGLAPTDIPLEDLQSTPDGPPPPYAPAPVVGDPHAGQNPTPASSSQNQGSM